MSCVTNWEVSPARDARHAPWPDGLHPKVLEAVARAGIQKPLYPPGPGHPDGPAGPGHLCGHPHRSGKTLCYNVPILDAIMANQDARALYLFPTKALSPGPGGLPL